MQVQLARFMLFEQRHDDVDAGPPPAGRLVLQPVSAPGTSGDRQPPAPWARYPKEVGLHDSFSIISRGSRSMSTPRSIRIDSRW